MDLFDESAGSHSVVLVSCAEGALSGFSSAEIGLLFFASGASIEARSTSGLLAPSRRDFEENAWRHSWSTGLTVSGIIPLNDPSLGVVDLIFEDAPAQILWETSDAESQIFESITTPAGTFHQILEISATATFQLKLKLLTLYGIQTIPAVLELGSLLWFQPEVGLVQQAFHSAEVSYEGKICPVAISSQMVLLEYHFSTGVS
ncbi:MAG: hypothetical protein JW929_12795 [Anaerolineales bacterium]|nr:hypothetical protein [Anaerolineales bacterium]